MVEAESYEELTCEHGKEKKESRIVPRRSVMMRQIQSCVMEDERGKPHFVPSGVDSVTSASLDPN